MKQSLQLKMGQHLTMTPQLQQAIKLLQLSTLDLQQEIQEALESNPLLEVNEEEPSKDNNSDQNNQPTSEPSADADTKSSEANKAENEHTAPTEAAEGEWSDQIPDELPVDSVWDDIYPNLSSGPGPGPAGDDENQLETRNSSATGLHDHLLEQLNVINLSDIDHLIAFSLIEGISPDGSLSISLDEVLQGLLPEFESLELDEVAAMLTLVQQFDPPGVASRDLGECLTLQLKQLNEDTPWRNESIKVVEQHLALLGNRDYNQLMRRSKLKEHELKEVIQLIQSLNPRPGSQIEPSNTEYIVPDVFVRKQNGRWLVELNPDTAPKLRVNNSYASMVKRADNSADNTYLRDHLQEARWFIKSLQSRNETLLKVSSQIVERQRNFLEYGPEAMKPLVLHDIADAVDMHESTISRVTTQKYMHTPRGIFELKYFFSSHVSTTSGGEVSSTAIRALIKKLCEAENPKKPLSDSKISQILMEQNIKVARRTVAKYRDSLLIPPSNERKRLV